MTNHTLFIIYNISMRRSKEEGKDQESINKVSHLTQDTVWESDKKQKKTSHS